MLRQVKHLARETVENLGYAAFPIEANRPAFLLSKLPQFLRTMFTLDPETEAFLAFASERVHLGHSQVLQDMFVQWVLGEKRGGFFVDFGATDGIGLSNSYCLERHYEWKGIVAEPARAWHTALQKNRKCSIEFDCVAKSTGDTVVFNETSHLDYSTMESFSDSDRYADERRDGKRYEIQTVSLNDLLIRHGAPKPIDYLSVDTEGSELEILCAFDFAAYRPRIITVEHNFIDHKRSALFNLMTGNGYRRRFEHLSMIDDWYVLD